MTDKIMYTMWKVWRRLVVAIDNGASVCVALTIFIILLL
jgi:hypothetical protein